MLLTVAEALELREGRTLAFTNGVFDILHAGHVTYLREASKLADILIVSLNSDESVRALKGPTRPIHPLPERALVLSAIRWVAGVTSFNEPDPRQIIELLRPEFHVKGGDYDAENMIETPTVRSYGGRVVILPFLEGHSTTAILGKL